MARWGHSVSEWRTGVVPKTGWYEVNGYGAVWLIRYTPAPEDIEDAGGQGPHMLWAHYPADSMEAIEASGWTADPRNKQLELMQWRPLP